MARQTKKQQLTKNAHANRTTPAPLLPADVLHQIFTELRDALEDSEDRASLLRGGSVARAWRSASRAVAYENISLPNASRVMLFSRKLKQSPKLASCVRSLDLSIASVWKDLGNKGSANWTGHAVLNVLRSCEALSSLALALGPTDSSSAAHLEHIFNNLSIFASFSNLVSFTLESAIWLSDLALLLEGWPSLALLRLHSLRGDCSRIPPPPTTKSIQHLWIKSNTLSEQHVRWFVGQPLTHLSIALPGLPSTFFTALEHLAPTLVLLRLTNRFAAKGAPAPPAASPLLPFLALSSTRVEELQLSGDLVGPEDKLGELLSAVSKVGTVTKLWIDDGMREPLERALRKGELAELSDLVNVGKKGTVAASFEKALDERGIEWSRE